MSNVATDVENYLIIAHLNINYQIRTAQHDGKKHMIVPVTMMVEGVHNGSRGPLLHEAEELGKVPQAFNGIPVVVPHPEDADGNFIPANSPEIIDDFAVGRVFNTRMDGDKLVAEAWLDEERLAAVSPEALQAILDGEPLEVSLGMFSEEEETSGEFNGETYNAIARNPRPDHLALLPGDVGACSWTDGCGIRNNKEGGNNVKRDSDLKPKKDWMDSFFADLISNAEAGMRELISNIQSKLDAMDTDLRMHFLQEVYPEYFVYEVRSREGGAKMYKRNYSVNNSGEVEFSTDEPTEVRKQVSFVPLKEGDIVLTRDNSNVKLKKEVNTMSDQKPCCEDMVDALIANAKSKFVAEDKEWLMTLKEDQLAKLVQNEVEEEKPPKKEETTPQLNAEQVKQIMKDSIKTEEDFLELVPENYRESFGSGLKLHKEQKAKMVQAIIANTKKDLWTEDLLNAKDMDELQRLYDSIQIDEPVNYSLQDVGGVTTHASSEIEPMLDPALERELETSKQKTE
jgi:hypothetical protein